MPLRNKRRHVTNEAQWEDQKLPGSDQYIVKVLKSMGYNLLMARKPCGEVHHVSISMKLRRHIWVKRGDYALVEPIQEGNNKVKAQIVKILNKYSIKFYKLNNIWPEEFVDNKKLQVKDEDLDFFENNNMNNQCHSECSEDSSDSEVSSDIENGPSTHSSVLTLTLKIIFN